MKRLLSILALFAFAFSTNVFASGAADSPEARVSQFYTWYIKTGSDLTFPLLKEGIFNYVAKDTVNKLRSDYRHNRLPEDVDYFTKTQDEDDQDWLSHIAPRQVAMLGDVAVVPVMFGSKSQTGVVVFMRKIAGVWKITKVDSTLDYR
jgi:hypothetical protein